MSASVRSPGRFTAMPSAIVSPASNTTGWPASSDAGNAAHASTWTPITSTDGRADFTAIATPLTSPPPPTGTMIRARSSTSSSSSSPSVPWPATTSGSSNGCTKAMPACSARRAAAATQSSTDPSSCTMTRAERRGALDLGDRGLARHVDLAGDAADTGGERQRLRVVARAARDDAVRRVRPERGELAQRAADLERARPLQRLRLDQDGAARALAQRLGRQDRRVARDVAHRLTSGGDVLRRDGARHSAYGTATTASKPTSAPRGSDATPNA